MEIVVENDVMFVDSGEVAEYERPVIVWTLERSPNAVYMSEARFTNSESLPHSAREIYGSGSFPSQTYFSKS